MVRLDFLATYGRDIIAALTSDASGSII